MKRLIRAGAAGLAATAFPAAAQERVDHTLSWFEVTTGSNTPVANPNGLLEPGESARIAISLSFTPAVGTTVPYTPPPPPGIGTMAGFGSMLVDLFVGNQMNPSPSGAGTWSFLERAPGWALGDPGYPVANGAVRWINAGQFVPIGMTANPANPIPDIWRGVWTPASYSARDVVWQMDRAITANDYPPSLLIQYGVNAAGAPLYVAKYVPDTYTPTTIPIIPAPASLLAVSALFLQRRRRGP